MFIIFNKVIYGAISTRHRAIVSKSLLRNIDMIRQILAFPNAKEIVNQLDIDMYNSLFHASKIQNEDVSLLVINMLLEKGANPLQKE